MLASNHSPALLAGSPPLHVHAGPALPGCRDRGRRRDDLGAVGRGVPTPRRPFARPACRLGSRLQRRRRGAAAVRHRRGPAGDRHPTVQPVGEPVSLSRRARDEYAQLSVRVRAWEAAAERYRSAADHDAMADALGATNSACSRTRSAFTGWSTSASRPRADPPVRDDHCHIRRTGS